MKTDNSQLSVSNCGPAWAEVDRLLSSLQSLPLAVADLRRQHQALTEELAGLRCENNELLGRIRRLNEAFGIGLLARAECRGCPDEMPQHPCSGSYADAPVGDPGPCPSVSVRARPCAPVAEAHA